VARDTTAVENALNTFITTFNDLTTRIAQQTRYDQDTDTKGPLLGDSAALQIRSRVYSTIQGKAVGISGPFDSLADIGIKVGQGGALQLDRDKLRRAVEQDYQAVADLVSARVQAPQADPTDPPTFTSLGVVSQMENAADSFINSVTGSLTRRSKSLSDEVDMQTQRIADFDARLASRRTILERQFLAMEQAIGQLQSQQSALSGITRIA